MSRLPHSTSRYLGRSSVCGLAAAITLLLPASAGSSAPGVGEKVRIPRGHSITIDGKLSNSEWDDATVVRVRVDANWTVRVYLKHDAENLYLAFEGVKHGGQRLFPEILLDPKNRKSKHWETGQWWLHVSGNLCEGNGEPNVYRKNGVFQCEHSKPGWEGYSPPQEDTEVIEVSVSFGKLGIAPKAGVRLGLALDMTDATGDEKQQWFFWPAKAKLGSPISWGEAELE